MPTLIGGNTNAPCMVIGEPAARFVLAEACRGRGTDRSLLHRAIEQAVNRRLQVDRLGG